MSGSCVDDRFDAVGKRLDTLTAAVERLQPQAKRAQVERKRRAAAADATVKSFAIVIRAAS